MLGMDTAYRMAAPVVLGVFIGYYLDQRLGTKPWLMLGLLFLGMLTGFWTIYKQVYYPDLVKYTDPSVDKPSDSDPEPPTDDKP